MLGPELEHADTVVDSKPSPRDAAWGRPHPASGAGGSVRLLRSFNPGQLSESQRQRWRLPMANWGGLSEDERSRWREWFDWAVRPGGELWDPELAAPNLEGACLDGVDLSEVELRGARLVRASLAGARLAKADLSGANLKGATLEAADLTRADLTGADLTGVRLANAELAGADLSEASLHGVDFTRVDLQDARLFATRISQPIWWIDLPRPSLLEGRTCFQPGLPKHPVQDVMGLPPLLRRRLADVQYLRELHDGSGRFGRAVIWLWGVTSQYGQSVVRWAVFTALLAVAFAIAFMAMPMSMWAHHVAGGSAASEVGRPDFLRALYFSVSTLMTLGLGDEVPVTGLGRLVTMTEVVVGYVMLGGLLSIFANKLARLS